MRLEKQAIVEEIRAQVGDSTFLLLADYRGLKVEQFNDLRAQLTRNGARVLVVKNRLLRQVAGERGWTAINPFLRGQSAMVTGKDVVQTAKLLKQFSAGGGFLTVKAGMMGELFLDAAQVTVLADLPSREALLGMLVGTVAAPLSRLVGVMKQKLSSLVYVLKAVEEKRSAK
jgi:large subunit ribosomal protein L10